MKLNGNLQFHVDLCFSKCWEQFVVETIRINMPMREVCSARLEQFVVETLQINM